MEAEGKGKCQEKKRSWKGRMGREREIIRRKRRRNLEGKSKGDGGEQSGN